MSSPSKSGGDIGRLLRAARRSVGATLTADGDLILSLPAGKVLRPLRFAADLVSEAEACGCLVIEGGKARLTQAGEALLAGSARSDAPLLAQHRPLAAATVATDEGDATVLVDLGESPLAWLARRSGRNGQALVGAAAFAAGERLRASFTRANMMPRVTANWEAGVAGRTRSNGAEIFSDAVITARERVHAALDAVGPELAGVLMDVCCFLKGLEEVEHERQWPARSAKVVLGLALDRLAAHYGLSDQARGRSRVPTRYWGAEGYRPTISERPQA